MGRRPRSEMEINGRTYHVIQRGNNREFIFGDDEDKDYLTGLFRLVSNRGCIIYGFVVMGNHYHLVLKTAGESLRSLMHRINLRYSKYFNRKHGRSGHVFQGRYKVVPVSDDRYVLSLLRYIHQNPVRAGMCGRLEDYEWSSDSYYRRNKASWVETSLALDIISAQRKTAVSKYIEFMTGEETGDYENVRAIGDIHDSVGETKENKKNQDRKSLDEILIETGAGELELGLIKGGSRRRTLTGYKLSYAMEALRHNYTLKAIGDNIKVSDVAVLDMLRRHNLIT